MLSITADGALLSVEFTLFVLFKVQLTLSLVFEFFYFACLLAIEKSINPFSYALNLNYHI